MDRIQRHRCYRVDDRLSVLCLFDTVARVYYVVDWDRSRNTVSGCDVRDRPFTDWGVTQAAGSYPMRSQDYAVRKARVRAHALRQTPSTIEHRETST